MQTVEPLPPSPPPEATTRQQRLLYKELRRMVGHAEDMSKLGASLQCVESWLRSYGGPPTIYRADH
jgi:hypothetical protein